MPLPWLIAGTGLGIGLIAGLIIGSDEEFREKVYKLLDKFLDICVRVIAIIEKLQREGKYNIVKLGIFNQNNRRIGSEKLKVAKDVDVSVGETYTYSN